MTPNQLPPISDGFVSTAGQVLVAFFAGIVALFTRNKFPTWRSFWIQAGSAAFVGYITSKACDIANVNDDIAVLICAVAAWAGPEVVMTALKTFLSDKLELLGIEAKNGKRKTQIRKKATRKKVTKN